MNICCFQGYFMPTYIVNFQPQNVFLFLLSVSGSLRACTYCCGVVLSYVNDQNPELSGDLQMLSEDLKRHLQLQSPENDGEIRSPTISTLDGEMKLPAKSTRRISYLAR